MRPWLLVTLLVAGGVLLVLVTLFFIGLASGGGSAARPEADEESSPEETPTEPEPSVASTEALPGIGEATGPILQYVEVDVTSSSVAIGILDTTKGERDFVAISEVEVYPAP